MAVETALEMARKKHEDCTAADIDLVARFSWLVPPPLVKDWEALLQEVEKREAGKAGPSAGTKRQLGAASSVGGASSSKVNAAAIKRAHKMFEGKV